MGEALAIADDLLSSFVKRWMGLASSSMAIGLDQIPKSLLPLLGARLFVPLSLLDVLGGMAIFFTDELILSRICFISICATALIEEALQRVR